MEVADTIEEIRTVCTKCGTKKAIVNAKIVNNQLITTGSDRPDLGAEKKYKAFCWRCWNLNKISLSTSVSPPRIQCSVPHDLN